MAATRKQVPAKKPAAPPAADDFFDEPAGDPDDAALGGGGDDDEYDLSDVDENAGFTPVPAGVYNAFVQDAEFGDSQRSGKKMITWMFEIADGEFAGKTLRYYTVLESDSGRGRLKKMLVRIAPQTDLKRFRPSTTPSELVGTPCRIKVAIRMYQGERRNDLKDVLPPATERVFEE